MATEYRYQRAGEEVGPVDFRELVRLVHEGLIHTDDLVIADWQQSWGPAAEVVGLFHTAGREDVLQKWQQEQKEKRRQTLIESGGEGVDLEEIEKMLDAEGGLNDREQALHLLEQAELAERELFRQKQRDAAHSESVSETIEQAINKIDERERQQQKKSILSFLTVGTVHSLFRISMAFGVANLVTYLVFNWSQTELQRFPARRIDPAFVKVFPLYGRCSEVEYFFLMLDTMIIAGIAGYWIARGMEQLTDE